MMKQGNALVAGAENYLGVNLSDTPSEDNISPKFNPLSDDFTEQERLKRRALALAATKNLFSTDISKLDDAAATGLYQASVKGIFDIEDSDGSVAFGKRAAKNPHDNIELLRRFCKGEFSLIQDDEYKKWNEMDEMQKFKYALETETIRNKFKSYVEGERGAGLWENLSAGFAYSGVGLPPGTMATARMTTGNKKFEKDAQEILAESARRSNYDTLTPEEQAAYRADVINDYDKKISKRQVLATFLAMRDGLSDRASMLLAKAYNTGDVDINEMEALSPLDRDRAYTALSIMRGDLKKGHILGIPTDLDDDTAFNRFQLGLYGFQQSVLGLATGAWDMGKSAVKWTYAKAWLDDAERSRYIKRWDAEVRAERALQRALPDADGVVGEGFQALMENLHWFIPYGMIGKGGKLIRAAQGVTEDAKWYKKFAATFTPLRFGRNAKDKAFIAETALSLSKAEHASTLKDLQLLDKISGGGWTKGNVLLARQLANIERYTQELADAQKAIKAAKTAGWIGEGAYWSGEAMAFSSFANEYIATCDAAGISRQDSVPMAAIIGWINAKIENIYVPGLESGLSAAEVKSLTFSSLLNAIRTDGMAGARQWLGNRVTYGLMEGAKVTLEEGAIEEPLQQIVIEHGKAIAATSQKLRENGQADLADQLNAYWDSIKDTAAYDLQTFLNTAIDMVPTSVGFGLTTIGNQTRRQHIQNAILRHENRAKYQRTVADANAKGLPIPAMPTMFERGNNGTLLFNPDAVDIDVGVADIVAKATNVRQLINKHWRTDDAAKTGTFAKDPNGLTKAITAARKVWNLGEGDVVRGISDAAQVDINTAEVLSDYFAAEAQARLGSPNVKAFIEHDLSTVDLSDKSMQKLLPGYVKGSFVHDSKQGFYSGQIKLSNGKVKTIAYVYGDISDKLNALADEQSKIDSQLGKSYDARIDTGTIGGKRWRELDESERYNLALKNSNALSSGRSGCFTVADDNGKEIIINADDIIYLSNGELGKIGYGAMATQGTVRHETWHSIWRFLSSELSAEDKQQLAKTLGVDTTGKNWEVNLDEAMAHQFEQYASGNYVNHSVDGVVARFIDSTSGKLVRQLSKLGLTDEIKNPKTGNAYALQDFYDAVLRGEIGTGKLGYVQTEMPDVAPDKKSTTEQSADIPLKVSPEEVEKADSEVAQTAEKTEPEAPPPPTSTKDNYTLDNPAEAQVPNARFYRVSAGDGVTLVGELVVSDASQLKTSYKGNLADSQLQNRGETQEGRALVEKIAGNPLPLEVGTVQPRANNGFIWTTPSLDVFIGNTRASGVTLAYDRGNGAALNEHMRQEAQKRGIEIPEGVKHPVVHFVLRKIESEGGKANIYDVVRMTNESVNRGMNKYEQAKNDADVVLKNNLVSGIVLNAEGNIDTAKSATAIGTFRQLTNAQGLIDENTDLLSEEGQARLKNAVLATILNGANPNLLARIISQAKHLDIENELNAIMRGSSEMMKLATAKPQYDLQQPLAEALDYYVDWRDRDEKLRAEAGKDRRTWSEKTANGNRKHGISWQQYMGQGDMFRTPSPEARIIGDLLAAARELRSFDKEDNESSAGKIRAQKFIDDYLNDYIANAYAANTETVDMFGTPPPTRLDIMNYQRTKDGATRFSTVAISPSDAANDPAAKSYLDALKRPDANERTSQLAPNGKRSNLTNALYHLVRTKRFKDWFGDWEKKAILDKAVDFALNGKPVASITGNEFTQNGQHDLVDRISAFYASIGGKVKNQELGDVILDRDSARSSLGHGIGREKAAAFAAVPDVIRNGFIFDRQENWKGRGVSSFALVAPIKMGNDIYVCEAIVEQKGKGKERRFYLHEVNLQSSLSDTIKTPTGGASIGKPSRPVRSILAKLVSDFNLKSVSKVVDENGEPLPVYHGSENNGFYKFNRDLIGRSRGSWNGRGFYFSSSENDARMYGTTRRFFLNLKNLFDTEDFDSLNLEIPGTDIKFLDAEQEISDIEKTIRLTSSTDGDWETWFYAVGDDNFRYLERQGKKIGKTQDDLRRMAAERLFSDRHGIDSYVKPTAYNYRRSLTAILSGKGYDGLSAPSSNLFPGAKEYVAFDPSQIKSADPVTYDDAGNVVPLSQRFNQQKNDIRFSTVAISPSDASTDPAANAYLDALNRPDANERTTLLAPNGKRSNLTNALYHLVRTKRFKDWFGDWERKARIDKLRNSKAIDFKWNGEYELNRNAARSWALDNLRKGYVNNDTGDEIGVFRDELRKVTSHGTHDEAHLKSIAAIPRIIQDSIFIDERPNAKDKHDYDTFRYYVAGINIDGIPYTVKVVVGVKNGKKYYDHDLTQIEKGNLIDRLSNQPGAAKENPLNGVYDTKLTDLLQVGEVSKVVDGNGEPLVVSHASDMNFNSFDMSRFGKHDWGFYGAGIYFSATTAHEKQYGNVNRHFFLNLRNPYDFTVGRGRDEITDYYNEMGKIKTYDEKLKHAKALMDKIVERGYDGAIANYGIEYISYNPSQVKSADPVTYDDAGNIIPLSQRFNQQKNDIRFSISHLYTGSAADYANRVPVLDKDGKVTGYRIDNGPSLLKIGTGEGTQVYGHGLYASESRGVAEGYADAQEDIYQIDGKPIEKHFIYNPKTTEERALSAYVITNGDKKEARRVLVRTTTDFYGKKIPAGIEALKWFDKNKDRLSTTKSHLYEQTFFTNRAKGDESHLLSWYDLISEENLERIKNELSAEGIDKKFGGMYWLRYHGMSRYLESGDITGALLDNGSTGDAVYETLSLIVGGPKAASEFLARADIDGIKYPIDSYGTTVKDGDKVGWNYVSFRDDNIRVDHKWVDGKQRFSVVSRSIITDNDFVKPSRDITLPTLPGNLNRAIGGEGKPVLIKKSIFEKNLANHPEITPDESREILDLALYHADIAGQTQPRKREHYWVSVNRGDDRNATVVVDVYPKKDNIEVVGWRTINDRGLERLKRQAEREDGQLLILSPDNGSAVALSALTSNLPSTPRSITNADESNKGDKKQLRFSISNLYTGSAADYANRVPVLDKDGKVTGYRIDNGPSLLKIGTGEGDQAYGWGLYASESRGVAEGYSHIAFTTNAPIGGIYDYYIDGEKADSPNADYGIGFIVAVNELAKGKSIDTLKRELLKNLNIENAKAAYDFLSEHELRIQRKPGAPRKYIYEQTWFTNRAPGDESHLLNWNEMDNLKPGNSLHEQLKWIRRQAKKEGVKLPDDLGTYGEDVYETLSNALGSPKAASEFLVRADIDGIKYPKHGDEAVWNYVSFRDDNIRVDHKWVDGKQRFSINASINPDIRVDVVDGRIEPAFNNLTTGEIRNYLRDRYQGREVTIRSDGTVVEFIFDGLTSALKKRNKHRRALHRLDKLVENSHFTRYENNDGQKKHKHLNGQFIYTAALRLNDGIYGVELKLDDPIVTNKAQFKGQTLKTKIADAVLSVGPRSKDPLPTSDYETSATETIRLGDIAPAPRSITNADESNKGDKKQLRFSAAAPLTVASAFPRLDKLSDVQLISAAIASKTVFGKSGKAKNRYANVNQIQRYLKAQQPNISNLELAQKTQDVLHAVRDISARMKEDLDRGVSQSQILQYLPDRMRDVFASEMTAEAAKGANIGSYHERASRMLEDKATKVLNDAVAVQSGVESTLLENTYGIDFSQTLMDLAENPYLKKDGQGNFLPLPGVGSGFDAESTPPTTAKDEREVSQAIKKAVDEIAQKSAEQLKQEDGQKKPSRLESNKDDDSAGLGNLSESDIAAIATRRAGVDLQNPRQLALFIAELARRWWVEKNELDQNAEAFRDRVALQFLRKTAANIYNKLVREITYSQSRDSATQAINGFEHVPTLQGLLSEMTFVGQLINARRIRETQQQMCEKLDQLLREKFGATGHFKADREELRRNVSAEMELRARYMRHAMWLTPNAAGEEAQRLRDELDMAAANFEAEDHDANQSKTFTENLRKLNILREFGALRYKPLATIESALNYWDNALEGETDAIVRANYERDVRTKMAAELLARAFHNPKQKSVYHNRGSLALSINEYIQGHMSITHLLRDMMRFAAEADATEAEKIVKWLELEIQKAGTRASAEKRRHANAFAAAIQQIYGRSFERVIADFAKQDERFAPFMGMKDGIKIKPTKGRAIQLMVSLLQVGHQVEVQNPDNPKETILQWVGGYHDNIVKHHREGQAQQISALLSPADLNLVKWLGQWYEMNRQDLSDVCQNLFGIGVYSETWNYFPVKMLLDKQGLEKGEAVGWSVFPKALSPRVRNERDFDTEADILQMFMSRMEEAAQWKAHAKLGLELRGIFGRTELQNAVIASHGAKANSLMLGFITDTLSGHGTYDRSPAGVDNFGDKIRGWAAIGALGGNVGVMFKQTTSIPAFGFEIGLTTTARHMMTAFTPAGFAAMNKIWNSEERKIRWDVGNSEAVKNALATNNKHWFMRIIKSSMITNKIGDCVPGLVIGQGIYRDALDRGMSEEDAMSYTWMLIERTQQSSRIENQPSFMRRSKFGRMLYQFLSTQGQYLQYEARAIRKVIANPSLMNAEGRKRWKELGRAAILNHFILSSAYFWMGQLYRSWLGQEPPEDELADWIISCLLGPYGALYCAGFTTAEALNRWVKGKSYASTNTVPSLNWISNIIVHDPCDIIDAIMDDSKTYDDVKRKMVDWAADFNAAIRDLVKIYRWRVDKEPQ